jgi:quercetin dioxygenase-like cupin family protein
MAARSRIAAVATVQVDNEWTRVTEWRFAPGAATGWHRHEFDYLVVPLVSGIVQLEEPGGERTVAMKAGASYSRPAGIEHDVINAGQEEYAFIEVEFKARRG